MSNMYTSLPGAWRVVAKRPPQHGSTKLPTNLATRLRADATPRQAKFVRAVLVSLGLLFMGAPSARAVVILGQEDWDPVSSAKAWTNTYGWTTLATPGSGGNTGGWLRVTFPEVDPEAGPDSGWSDIIRTSATNLFAGEWNTNMSVQFDFWASNKSPHTLQVLWQSSTNSETWGYTFDSPGTGAWTTLDAPFLNWQDWMYDGATEAQYLADLSSIDWVGVYVYRNTAEYQIYGLDNFMLTIPEPAECLMLVLALMTTGMAVRRKRLRVCPASSSA